MFSGKVYHPEPPHAQSLFLFPIVFGINICRLCSARLSPVGSDPELVCQKILFWKLVFPWVDLALLQPMENILWDDVVFKLRKTRQKLALSLTPLGAVRAAAEGSGYKNRRLGKSLGVRFDSRLVCLYGAIRSEPETAAQSSCSHFWTSLGTLCCLSSACIVVGAVTVTPAESFVSPRSESSPPRKHLKKKKKESHCRRTTAWQFIRIQANVCQPFQVPLDSAFDRLKMNSSQPSARYHSRWRSWRLHVDWLAQTTLYQVSQAQTALAE